TNTNTLLIADSLFTQQGNVQADNSTLTVTASTIAQSVDSLVTTNSALSYQATQGDISLARINSQRVVKLDAAGKVFSVLDSDTATNVTAEDLIFTSVGHFVERDNSGFINAAIALEKKLLKVKAEIFVGAEIKGNVILVSDSQEKNYVVNEEVVSKDVYFQFLSQSTNADYSEIAESTLTPTQMEFALSRFVGTEITETDTSSATTSSEPTSLLSRLLQEVQSIEESETNDYGVGYGVDYYYQLSDNAEDVFQGNQSTKRTFGSLSFDIVNPVGNRQIDVLGDSLNDYLYDYLLDTEEVLLGRIL
ncbi:MAG: hypothetical protein ACI9N9_002834, partial [Enterobacterales bacterium]